MKYLKNHKLNNNIDILAIKYKILFTITNKRELKRLKKLVRRAEK